MFSTAFEIEDLVGCFLMHLSVLSWWTHVRNAPEPGRDRPKFYSIRPTSDTDGHRDRALVRFNHKLIVLVE